jgi:hypothetical protein
MASVRDVVGYFCLHHSVQRTGMSLARLTKMVYLADWKSALDRGRTITDPPIPWKFDYCGPTSNAIIESIEKDRSFVVKRSVHKETGESFELVSVLASLNIPSLSSADQQILNFVLEKAANRSWADFIRLVYSTFPIITQGRFANLDLVKLAQRYRANSRLLEANDHPTEVHVG